MMATSYSNSLVLEDSEKGVVVRGIKDDVVAAKSGLQAGDELAAATINLDQLSKDEVMKILKVLEPYNTTVLTKKDLNASAGLHSLGLGLDNSTELLNMKQDLSLDASAGTPGLSLGDLNGKLNASQGLNGGINAPTINGDLPGLSLNTRSSDTEFKMPSLSLSGSDIKGDLGGAIETSDLNVSAPQIKSPSASVSVNKPEIKSGNYAAPKFSMPNFSLPQLSTPKANVDVSGDTDLSYKGNIGTPDLNLSAPKLDFPKADLDLNGPGLNLNGSDVNVGIPNVDANIDPPSTKFKWPHENWKVPKIKGPDGDLNAKLPKADVNLSTPKLDGKINTPSVDIDLPNADLQGPELNAQAPNLEMDPPSGKFNFSKLKNLHFRKPNADLDANLNTPDVGLSVPKVDGDGEIKTPDVDLSLPKADLEGPDLNLNATGINAEAPSGKMNWFRKLKKPKVQLPKADLDANLDIPDLNLQGPKIGGDVNLQNADIDVPDAKVDIKAPSGGIKWPRPKWNKPKAKADMDLNAGLGTPKIEGEIDTPDLSLPKGNVDINLPDADLGAHSGKIKFPTFKKPKIHHSGPKINIPDANLNADADLKAPDLNLNPELNGPDVDLKLPKGNLDVNAPNAEIEAPSGKFKWPTFKKRNFTLPDPKFEGPDCNLEGPDLNLSAPNADINGPDINLDAPKADLDIKTPDVKSPSGKFKWFTWKKGKTGTLKGPKLDLDGDVQVPDVDMKTPDVNLSTPKLDGNIDLPEPGLDVGDLDLKVPDMSLNMPKADLQSPNLDLSAPKSNFSLPTADLKTPKLDLSDINVPNLNLSSSEIDGKFSTPSIDAGLPKAEIEAPNAKLNTTKIDLNLPKMEHKPNFPHFNLPNISGTEIEAPSLQTSADAGLKAPKLDLGTADANLSLPGIDMSAPKVKGPEIDVETPKVDANVEKPKWSLFKKPDIGFFRSKSETPEIDANADVTVNTPDTEGKIALPDFSASASEGGMNLNTVTDMLSEDSSVPVFRFHRLPRHSMDGSEDFDLYKIAKLDSGEKEYVMSKGVRLPKVNAKSTPTEKVDIMERLKMAMEKSPSTNASPTDARSSIDLQAPLAYLDGSVSAGDSSLVRGGTFKVEKPESSLSLIAPEISTTDENDKLSLGLSNMLGLNVKDSDAI